MGKRYDWESDFSRLDSSRLESNRNDDKTCDRNVSRAHGDIFVPERDREDMIL